MSQFEYSTKYLNSRVVQSQVVQNGKTWANKSEACLAYILEAGKLNPSPPIRMATTQTNARFGLDERCFDLPTGRWLPDIVTFSEGTKDPRGFIYSDKRTTRKAMIIESKPSKESYYHGRLSQRQTIEGAHAQTKVGDLVLVVIDPLLDTDAMVNQIPIVEDLKHPTIAWPWIKDPDSIDGKFVCVKSSNFRLTCCNNCGVFDFTYCGYVDGIVCGCSKNLERNRDLYDKAIYTQDYQDGLTSNCFDKRILAAIDSARFTFRRKKSSAITNEFSAPRWYG